EVDVGAFEYSRRPSVDLGRPQLDAGSGGTATLTEAPPLVATTWTPPAPDFVMPAIFPDSVEMLIYKEGGGSTLVGAVELVSPGNKDRGDARTSFAAKCATYLREGVGLVTIDIVTNRGGNPHNDLIELLGTGE